MKKITLFISFLIGFTAFAQFPQGFEGTFPPTGWVVFRGENDLGILQDWTTTSTNVASGTKAASVRFETVEDGLLAEDWLVTSSYTINATTSNLAFFQRQGFETDFGTTYSIKVSTTSQTDISTFIDVNTQLEADFPEPVTSMNGKIIDMSAYIGQTVYIAFVMSNNNGDNWVIDNVDFIGKVSAPDCSSSPVPSDGAIDVAYSNVPFSWSAVPNATSYDLYSGLTPDDVTNFIGNFTTTSTILNTGVFETTLYWKIVPKNIAGEAIGCSVWSFTTAGPPPPPSNDNFANANALACGDLIYGDTTFATIDEDDAPDGFGANMDSPNIWYKYTGTGTEQSITLNLCNSQYDTSVLVYTGSSGNLTLIAANDDDTTCGTGLTLRSRVKFNSDGLSTYYINVEGFKLPSATSGAVGTFTMDVTCESVTPPAVANQTCASALSIVVDGTDVSSDNSFGDVSSTNESGCDPFGSIQDVWFSFIAPADGNVTCTVTNGTMTSSNFKLYSGSCNPLTVVANSCNTDVLATATESLTGLTAGETYFVQVWSNAVEQGTFTLKLDGTLATDTFDSSSFKSFPNPVKDVLNLSYNKNITNVAVYNLLGQEVIVNVLNSNQTQIDMSNLSAGTYLVKVTADNQVKTIKVIKE